MHKLSIVLVACLALFGCKTHDLNDKWEPLKKIVQRGGSDRILTTTSPVVWVADLDGFLERNPEGQSRFNSFMLHEQWHGIRQEKLGVFKFIKKYLTDREFRWEEEKAGWWLQIELRLKHGPPLYSQSVKKSLKGYQPSLADDEEIDAWVDSVYNGTYQPSNKLQKFLDDFIRSQ